MMEYEQFSNPHNSSLFRKLSSTSEPLFHVTKFMAKTILPIEDELEVTDEEMNPEEEALIEKRHMEVLTSIQPATVHLAKSIRISKDGEEYMPAITGVNLNESFLKKVLLEKTSVSGQSELKCSNHSELSCILLDHTGHVLGTNQPQVSMGDFLGSIDPELMKHLVEKEKVFLEHKVHDYQALCTNKLECNLGVRSFVAPTLDLLLHIFMRAVYALQHVSYILFRYITYFTRGKFITDL